jgi:hypothetical protein
MGFTDFNCSFISFHFCYNLSHFPCFPECSNLPTSYSWFLFHCVRCLQVIRLAIICFGFFNKLISGMQVISLQHPYLSGGNATLHCLSPMEICYVANLISQYMKNVTIAESTN